MDEFEAIAPASAKRDKDVYPTPVATPIVSLGPRFNENVWISLDSIHKSPQPAMDAKEGAAQVPTQRAYEEALSLSEVPYPDPSLQHPRDSQILSSIDKILAGIPILT